jgi:hypothetical protein
MSSNYLENLSHQRLRSKQVCVPGFRLLAFEQFSNGNGDRTDNVKTPDLSSDFDKSVDEIVSNKTGCACD